MEKLKEPLTMIALGGISWLTPQVALSMISSFVLIGYTLTKWYYIVRDKRRNK